ncbi:hypothetical protein D3C71_1694780 [compost metagenome]
MEISANNLSPEPGDAGHDMLYPDTDHEMSNRPSRSDSDCFEIWLRDAGGYVPTAGWALAAVLVAAAIFTESQDWNTLAAAWDPGSAFPAL